MSAGIARRALIVAAGVVGLIPAVTGVGTAEASQRLAVSGTEYFQLMSTSATSNPSVIAYGVFTAHGTDVQGSKVDTIKFADGSFQVAHGPGTGPHTFNPKACMVVISQYGNFTIGHGTGAYAGMTGSGKYHLSLVGIGAKVGGGCSPTKPPAAFQLLIRAAGTVQR